MRTTGECSWTQRRSSGIIVLKYVPKHKCTYSLFPSYVYWWDNIMTQLKRDQAEDLKLNMLSGAREYKNANLQT